jgi:alpha-mannosidase
VRGGFHPRAAVQVWYKNLDKIIAAVNTDGHVHAFYSTPADYFAAKAAYSKKTWPLKVDDFFPYADRAHAYWTGAVLPFRHLRVL